MLHLCSIMSEEKNSWLKAPALSTRSLSVLSSLDSVFKNKEVNKRSDTFVLSREFSSYNNHIKWVIDKSSFDKISNGGIGGPYIESPAIKSSYPCIRKFLLYPYGKIKTMYGYPCTGLVCFTIIFKSLPKGMSLQCEAAVLGKEENVLTSQTYFGDTKDLNEINFESFFNLDDPSCCYLINNKLTIKCIIRCISKVHKCVSDQSKYQAQEIFESNNTKRSLVNGKFSDVTLKLDSKSIKLHKVILASESPALTVLFRSSNKDILDLSDHKNAVIEDLLSFIYTGNIEILKFNHVCELYIAADEFGVWNLRDLCSVFLSNSLSKSNIPYILDLSKFFKDRYLIEMCLKYVKQNDIKSDSFIELRTINPYSLA